MNGRERLFISVLGTNNYLSCNYFYNEYPDRKVEDVRFVQEAILRLERDEAGTPDHVLIFLTEEAEKRNWLDDGHLSSDGRVMKTQGLESRLKELDVSYESVRIPSGKSENEIWEIFSTISGYITKGARLHIDVTHSFRSLSMIMLAVVNYAKVVKEAVVEHIHYGAMEALGSFREVEALPLAARNVPIFDLTPFDAILDWSQAVDSFKYSGNAKRLHQLAYAHIKPVLAATAGQDEQATAIRGFVNALNDFCDSLVTNRGPAIGEKARRVSESLGLARQARLLPPLVPLFQGIEAQLEGFEGDALDVALATARWCLDHNFIPQGYTALQEGVISWCLDQYGQDILDTEKRTAVSSAFVLASRNMPEEKWDENARKHAGLVKNLLADDRFKAMRSIVDRLTQYRNNINHDGYNQDRIEPARFQKRLEDLITEIEAVKAKARP